jgi:hypothetical protein
MGHSLPKGAQRFECMMTVSGGGSDILWGATTMFNGISGTIYSAESRMGEEGSGVGV